MSFSCAHCCFLPLDFMARGVNPERATTGLGLTKQNVVDYKREDMWQFPLRPPLPPQVFILLKATT